MLFRSASLGHTIQWSGGYMEEFLGFDPFQQFRVVRDFGVETAHVVACIVCTTSLVDAGAIYRKGSGGW